MPERVVLTRSRKLRVLEAERRIGYDDVAFLAGGIDAWRRAGLPIASVEELDAAQAHARLATGAVLLDVTRQTIEAKLAGLRRH